MSEPVARFLCTGDLHLGRYPSRIPGARKETMTVDAVWQSTVEYAISQGVDAVFLTGDVVDWENRFYEAFGPLQRGLNQLFNADIPVYAVAGNHDFSVLPRLADTIENDHFHLLGEGGAWEIQEFEKDGVSIANIAGWSFPENKMMTSPFSSFERPQSGLPLIGLIHGDLDQQAGSYAPFHRGELVDTRASAWLLGHIHRPEIREESGMPIVYVGSLQPLDPGEPGVHGPWVMSLSKNHAASFNQVPLATLRYRHLSVDASSITDEESFDAVITSAITDDLQEIVGDNTSLRRVIYRLILSGRTAIQPRLEQFALRMEAGGLEVPLRDVAATVDKISFDTTPDHDLDEIAREPGPPAVVAKLLRAIERGDPLDEYEPLLKRIRSSVEAIGRANAFQPLRANGRDIKFDNEELRATLHRQGMNLLDQLMEQKNETSHG